MEQDKKSLRIVFLLAGITAGFLLFFTLLTVAAAPTPRPAEELPLSGCQNGCDLNRGAGGDLYLSDYDAGEIWRIQPATGLYTLYQVSGSPVDGRPDGLGNIWYTDGGETFSRLSLATGLETTWVLTNFESFNGLAFDLVGHPWLVESFGFNSKIHRFDPGTSQLCGYHFGGVYSYYLLYSQGVFWALNWFQEEIIRFDPGTLSVKSWAMMAPAGDPQGLTMDQDGHLWWTERTGRINRLEPAINRQTRYDLPAGTGSRVEMVEARDGQIAYTESISGVVGILDPAVVTGTTSTLSTAAEIATESCFTLSPEAGVQATLSGGTLSWTDIVLDTSQDQSGWEIYRLPEDAKPYGLASGAGYQWLTDPGRGQLVRFRPLQPGMLKLVIDVRPSAAPHGAKVSLVFTISYSATDLAPAKNIVLTDDLCPTIVGPASGGDANQDGYLDVDEAWVYLCQFTIPEHQEAEDDPLLSKGMVEGQYLNGLSLDPVAVHHETDILHQSDYDFVYLPLVVGKG